MIRKYFRKFSVLVLSALLLPGMVALTSSITASAQRRVVIVQRPVYRYYRPWGFRRWDYDPYFDYYSRYGHIETMANAVAEGAREAGTTVDIKRVPELVPAEIAKASHYKLDQAAPVAKIDDLADYDAIIVGTGTRFGRMSSQMANFLDQAGGLWMKGALHGKVGGAFASTATQHGGQETTLFSLITNLLHFGMTVVGLNYGFAGQMKLDEITGGSPYGATTIAGGDGSRQPSANELAGARYQGRVIAETAIKLHG